MQIKERKEGGRERETGELGAKHIRVDINLFRTKTWEAERDFIPEQIYWVDCPSRTVVFCFTWNISRVNAGCLISWIGDYSRWVSPPVSLQTNLGRPRLSYGVSLRDRGVQRAWTCQINCERQTCRPQTNLWTTNKLDNHQQEAARRLERQHFFHKLTVWNILRWNKTHHRSVQPAIHSDFFAISPSSTSSVCLFIYLFPLFVLLLLLVSFFFIF